MWLRTSVAKSPTIAAKSMEVGFALDCSYFFFVCPSTAIGNRWDSSCRRRPHDAAFGDPRSRNCQRSAQITISLP